MIVIWLWRNAKYQAQRSRGFTPAAVAPQNAITPEQVLRHYPLREGAVWGTGTVPLRHLVSAVYIV